MSTQQQQHTAKKRSYDAATVGDNHNTSSSKHTRNEKSSIFLVDIHACDVFIQRNGGSSTHRQKPTISFKEKQVVQDESNPAEQRCAVLLYGRNAAGRRVSIVVYDFCPLVFLTDKIVEDNAELFSEEDAENAGGYTHWLDEWIKNIVTFALQNRQQYYGDSDSQSSSSSLPGSYDKLVCYEKSGELKARHLKGYTPEEQKFVLLSLYKEETRRTLQKQVEIYENENYFLHEKQQEQLSSGALKLLSCLREAYVDAAQRFIIETGIRMGAYIDLDLSKLSDGESRIWANDKSGYDMHLYADVEYIVSYEDFLQCFLTRPSESAAALAGNMQLPPHFTTCSLSVACDKGLDHQPVPRPSEEQKFNRYNTSKNYADPIRYVAIHAMRTALKHDQQHALMPGMEECCFLLKLAETDKGESHEDPRSSWTNFGTQIFEDALRCQDGLLTYKFSQEHLLIEYALQMLSTLPDVICGWKLFFDSSCGMDQSIHYLLNRLMHIRRTQPALLSQQQEYLKNVFAAGRIRKGKMHSFDRMAAGMQPHTTLKFQPVLDQYNPFTLVPCIDLFTYRDSSHKKELLSTLEDAFWDEYGGQEKVPPAINAWVSGFKGVKHISNTDWYDCCRYHPHDKGLVTGEWPEYTHDKLINHVRWFPRVCQAMLYDRGVLFETLATADLGGITAQSVWSRGNSHLVQQMFIIACGSILRDTKRWVVSETPEFSHFVEESGILEGKYEGAEVFEKLDENGTRLFPKRNGRYFFMLDFKSMYPSQYAFYGMCHSNLLPITKQNRDEVQELIDQGRAFNLCVSTTRSIYVAFVIDPAWSVFDGYDEDDYYFNGGPPETFTITPQLMQNLMEMRQIIKDAIKREEQGLNRPLVLQMLRKREGALKRQTNVGYGTQGSKRVNGPLRNVLLAAAVTAKGRHLIQYTCRLIEQRMRLILVSPESSADSGVRVILIEEPRKKHNVTENEDDDEEDEEVMDVNHAHEDQHYYARIRILAGDTDGLKAEIHPDDLNGFLAKHKLITGRSEFRSSDAAHVARQICQCVDDHLHSRDFDAHGPSSGKCGGRGMRLDVESLLQSLFLMHSKQCAINVVGSTNNENDDIKHKGMPYSSLPVPPCIAQPMQEIIEHFLTWNERASPRNAVIKKCMRTLLEATQRIKQDAYEGCWMSSLERYACLIRYKNYKNLYDGVPSTNGQEEQQQQQQQKKKQQYAGGKKGGKQQDAAATASAGQQPLDPGLRALQRMHRERLDLPLKFPREHVQYLHLLRCDKTNKGETLQGRRMTVCLEELQHQRGDEEDQASHEAQYTLDAREYLKRMQNMLQLLFSQVFTKKQEDQLLKQAIFKQLIDCNVFQVDERQLLSKSTIPINL